MKPMTAREIRDRFLEFFQENNHLLIQNASIIPKNDPTLLFINSGMAPIKKYFTGEETPKSPRLCNVQPCIRTIDIDEIGDKHHLTSFQMLGSWSIGDYFKEQAILLAFKFLTQYLDIPKDRLYATVFSGDKNLDLPEDIEAKTYWEKAGMPENHIISCGMEDNFWGPTSEVGPCGPCTEVFYDTGKGKEYIKGGEFDTKERYIEIWNAGVFMQLNKNADGTYSKLNFKSVDTGAGLERLAMVLNGYSSVYETDMLSPIKKCIATYTIASKAVTERDLRILTDHFRTISLILSEGVKPSNEGRGYIPRKLIRKCLMILKKSKIKQFDYEYVLKFIINKYSELYPDFIEKEEMILSEFIKEKIQFEKVLDSGLERLEEIKSQSKAISGEQAFELVTTYGVPFDIVKDYANDANISVDIDGFNQKLQKHKEISKSSEKNSNNILNVFEKEFAGCSSTKFIGYDSQECKSNILKVLVNGEADNQLKVGDKVAIVLDSTCMYAESGGQMADRGVIKNSELEIEINDVKKNKNGTFIHFGSVKSGTGSLAGEVDVRIDAKRRLSLANNHSAVHLLHSALRTIFGKDLHQAGSKVEQDSLRFDFNYDKSMSEEDIFKIENLVNLYIRENFEQITKIKNLTDAVKEGAMALFESKSSNKVRVVSFGEVSKELCGGTHTSRTGNIGLFCIKSVENIGKGMKRITALTGDQALRHIQKERQILKNVCGVLNVKSEQISDKIKLIIEKNGKRKTDKNDKISLKDVKIIINKNNINCGYIVKNEFCKSFTDDLIDISDKIEGIILCIVQNGDKKRLIVTVAAKLKGKVNANELLANINQNIGGKGGGTDRVASGGAVTENDLILKSYVAVCNELKV